MLQNEKRASGLIQFVATYLGHKDGDGERKHRHKKQTPVAKRMVGPYPYQTHIRSRNCIKATLPNVLSLVHFQEH